VSKIETSIKNLQAKVNLAVKDAKSDRQMHAANIKSLGTKVENVRSDVKALKDKEPMTFTQDDFNMVKATADLALAGYEENKQWLNSMNKLFETIVQAQERKKKDEKQRVEDSRCNATSRAARTPDTNLSMSLDDNAESVNAETMGAMFDDEEDIAREPHNDDEEIHGGNLGSMFADDNARGQQGKLDEDGLGNVFEDDDMNTEETGGASSAAPPHNEVQVNHHDADEATSEMEVSESEYVPPPPHDGQYSSEIETSSGSKDDTEAVTTVTEESETGGHENLDSSNAGSIIAPPPNPLHRLSSCITAAHNAASETAARKPSAPPFVQTAPTNASVASPQEPTNEDVDSSSVFPPLQPPPRSPPVPIEEMVNFGNDD